MAIRTKLATAAAAVALTSGLMAAAAAPAEAAWQVRYIGYWSAQADCEAAREQHGAGLDPSWAFVAPNCSLHPTYNRWYYAFFFNNA